MKNSPTQPVQAVFTTAPEGGYNVVFPDFPGCVTFGHTFEKAQQMAREVLELWLEELAAQGEDITVPQEQPRIIEIRVQFPVRNRSHALAHR